MLRPVLTLLLLLHYLLVVGTGVVGRAAAPEPRPFAYVHSPDCQLQNAWRGGHCFEDCNGAQYHQGRPAPTMPQLLASLKGVDVHCLPGPAAPLVAAPVRRPAGQLPAHPGQRVPEGVRGGIDLPPRRG